MEQKNSEYQSLLAVIHSLHQQVNLLEAMKRQQDTATLRREIEEHFERCIHALTVRRDIIISELDALVVCHEEEVSNIQAKLNEKIANCNDILQAGTLLYKSNKTMAEGVWKAEKDKPLTQYEANARAIDIQLELSSELLTSISSHGSVCSPSRNPIATTKTSEAPPPITPSHSTVRPTQHFPIPTSSVPSYTSTSTTSAINVAPITIPTAPKQIIPSFTKAKTVSTFFSTSTTKFSNALFGRDTKGICFDSNNSCLYVARRHSIIKLTLQGESSEFASVDNPYSIAFNTAENSLFVTHGATGSITKIGLKGGQKYFATVATPTGISIHNGILYASSNYNHEIYTVTSHQAVSRLTGNGQGFADGDGTVAKFNSPRGLCFDESSQSLLVCDCLNSRIRRVSLTGVVSTVCEIERPQYIAITASGIILVTSLQHRVYQVFKQAEGYHVAVIGDGREGNRDGDAKSSRFSWPACIAVHEPSHSCFVVDYGGIRRITFEDEKG